MHVPDGPVPIWLLAILWVVSILFLFVSGKMVNKKFDDKLVPYIGVLAAVIFAAQFVNFPVPPASSGHLVGTTLLAVLLGPWAAMLIMGLVLFVQALYGDGGILAYGLNFFNMGVVGSFVGWTIALILFKGLSRFTDEKKAVIPATAIAAFVTIIVSAFVLGLQLLSVPGFTWDAVMVLTGVHVIIAIGEAILTSVILLYFVKAKPSVISFLKDSETKEMSWIEEFPLEKPVAKEVD